MNNMNNMPRMLNMMYSNTNNSIAKTSSLYATSRTPSKNAILCPNKIEVPKFFANLMAALQHKRIDSMEKVKDNKKYEIQTIHDNAIIIMKNYIAILQNGDLKEEFPNVKLMIYIIKNQLVMPGQNSTVQINHLLSMFDIKENDNSDLKLDMQANGNFPLNEDYKDCLNDYSHNLELSNKYIDVAGNTPDDEAQNEESDTKIKKDRLKIEANAKLQRKAKALEEFLTKFQQANSNIFGMLSEHNSKFAANNSCGITTLNNMLANIFETPRKMNSELNTLMTMVQHYERNSRLNLITSIYPWTGKAKSSNMYEDFVDHVQEAFAEELEDQKFLSVKYLLAEMVSKNVTELQFKKLENALQLINDTITIPSQATTKIARNNTTFGNNIKKINKLQPSETAQHPCWPCLQEGIYDENKPHTVRECTHYITKRDEKTRVWNATNKLTNKKLFFDWDSARANEAKLTPGHSDKLKNNVTK